MKRAWLLLLAPGCFHYHRDDGAPGLVDLERPPDVPALRAVEPPLPPGQRMLVLDPAFGFVGGGRGLGERARGAASVAVEVAIERGEIDSNDQPLPGRHDHLRLPMTGWGLALGWQAYLQQPWAGPLSLELRRRLGSFLYAGAGPLYQPAGGRPGAVATLALGIFGVRAGYVGAEGAFLCGGLHLSFPVTWVATR